MSAALHIGKAGARRFELPLDMATQASAIVGVRGKGKTNTAVVMVEEILDQGVQVIVSDPTDVWWGLKSSRDGKRAGHPVVILGGEHGDLPLSEGSGAAVADFAVENRVPMILSLRHLRKAAAQRLMQDFAEQLYHRKGESAHRRPLLFVMDEASRFIPQRVGPEQARLVGAIEDIVRQGRSSGFGVALIDQRPASVNKDVLTQIELLVCHAVTSPQDRKALDEWIQGKDSAGHRVEFLNDLASLDRGEAWFWMPMANLFSRVHVRERKTFDSSRTPEIGEDPISPERFAQVDLGKLKGALEAAVVEAIANDPKTLKRRIRDLEAALAAAEGPAEAEVQGRIDAAVEDAWAEARTQAEAVASERVASAIAALRSDALPHLEGLKHVLTNGWTPPATITERVVAPDGREQWRVDGPIARRAHPTVPASSNAAPRERPAAHPRPRPAPSSPASRAGAGSGAQHRVLDTIAWYETIGMPQPTQVQVAGAIGVSVKKSTWRGLMAPLRAEALVEDLPDKRLALTSAGRALAAKPDRPPTRRELHARILVKLSGPTQSVLTELFRIYPRGMTRDQIAELAGTSKEISTFRGIMADLRKDDLIVDRSKDDIVAAAWLFPEGLR